MRATVAEISKKNLIHNVKSIKKIAPHTPIMAVVKANAYGHGILDTAKILKQAGVDFFGVAFTEEGVQLRKSGNTKPIIVLVPTFAEEARLFCEYDLQVAACSLEFIRGLSEEAVRQNSIVKAHLFIDTGMSREGIRWEDAVPFMQECSKLPNIEFVGVCTHFASAASDVQFAKKQLRLFLDTIKILKEAGFTYKYIHSANSSAIPNVPESHLTLIRPGMALYGYPPAPELSNVYNVKPVLTLKTRVIFIRRIQQGDSVSYDRKFIAKQPTTIATIPIGYGDGFFWNLTGKAQCLINGKRYNLVGAICMDESMVDVGDDNINIGDDVILIGKQGNESIDAYEVANKIGTIPYEILTAIAARVPRVVAEE